MIERSFILKDEMGLHARPAAILMMKMLQVQSTVELSCNGNRADGKDVMSIMAMNTVAGDEVVFRIDGPDEAEAMKAEYEQNLQNARAEANEIVANAQKTATARGEEIVGEARAQAAALKQKAEADIAQERKKAVNEVKDEIGGIAMEIASKVVEREIREEDHRDLIDEFIKNVGEAS